MKANREHLPVRQKKAVVGTPEGKTKRNAKATRRITARADDEVEESKQNFLDANLKKWIDDLLALPKEVVVNGVFAARAREVEGHGKLVDEMTKQLVLRHSIIEGIKKTPKSLAMGEARSYWRKCREGRVPDLNTDEPDFPKKFIDFVKLKWPILTSQKHLKSKLKEWEFEFSSPPFARTIERPTPDPPNDHAERARLMAMDKRQLVKILIAVMTKTGQHRQEAKLYLEKNRAVRDGRSVGGKKRAALSEPMRKYAEQLYDLREKGKARELYPDQNLIDKVRKRYPGVPHSTVASWLTRRRKEQRVST